MKVTLINTLDSGGGAALACKRLMAALVGQNIDTRMLVQKKTSEDPHIYQNSEGTLYNLKIQYDFLAERIPFILFQEREKSVRFAFSPANSGSPIAKNQLVLSADLLHLHWTNSGFLSVEQLQDVLALNKPVVWTLHDMWTFTGGCHYAGICDHFENSCGDCYFLRKPRPNDLSHGGWLRKQSMYQSAGKIVFVACSNWLAGVAKRSSLLRDFQVEVIPNPIDTALFSPKGTLETRQKWNVNPNAKVLLFGAANINDKRKGLSYLVDALKKFNEEYAGDAPVEMVIFGKNKSFDTSALPFKVHNLSVIRSQSDMAELYSLADLFILPSLEDNLPNTVMESMACGTPVVSFNTGGIPDLIDHLLNGYMAAYKSADDLAFGISWVLENNAGGQLSANAREKVLKNFTNEQVGGRYAELYKSLLNE